MLFILSMPQFTCKMEMITKAPTLEVTVFVMIKWKIQTKCSEGSVNSSNLTYPTPGYFTHTILTHMELWVIEMLYFPQGN